MEKFHNNYNPAYQVTNDGTIVYINLDTEYSYDSENYRAYDRSKYYNHSDLLTRREALEKSILILEQRVKEYREELENLKY